MLINELNRKNDFLPLIQQKQSMDGLQPTGAKFSDTLKELIGDVNDMQIEAGKKTEQMIKGEPIDIHDVMISSQKAKTSFQLLLELRNKGLDFYREVSRMQV
jgi:flagellar hook-basal body complex protein FliE